VISIRSELIAYYERKGYRQSSDKLLPFIPTDSFVILKQPLFFATFEKFI
jgi:hypothetical protein